MEHKEKEIDSDLLPTMISKGVFEMLGYEQVQHPNGHPYYQFQNKSGLVHPDYGKMARGKIIVIINLQAGYSYPFICIKDDGGTRTVFHGIIENTDQLKTILKIIR